MLQRQGESEARSPAQGPETTGLVMRFLRSRIVLSPATIRNNRWALMRLADAHPILPMDLPTLIAFMESEARYLNGSSQETFWKILRVFYGWARKQNGSIPMLPHVFFGRRRRGEKRGARRRLHQSQ